MLATSTDLIEGARMRDGEVLGAGDSILGANVFCSLLIGLHAILGGRRGCRKAPREGRRIAVKEMTDGAARLRAVAMMGARSDHKDTGGKGFIPMVCAAGRAVVIV